MPEKRYSLFVLAVLLLACVAFALTSKSFAIHSLGIVAIFASVWLIRASNVHRPYPGRAGGDGTSARTVKRLGLVEWTVGAGSLLAWGGSYFYLRNDALNGYHQVLPVYIFAGLCLTCVLICGYLVAKLLR